MKCLVPIKRVIDYSVKVRIKNDGSGVETDYVKMSMNPFDEIALEEAVRLKEANVITEILAVSIGTKLSQETLRVALARQADRAMLIETELNLEPLNIAKILKTLVEREAIDLVLLGKQAIDNDCNQTGQMLAGLLGWPQGTFASKLQFNVEKKEVLVTREIDGGLETLALTLPAVITTDLRLNDPRYISLPNVMKAKNKEIKIEQLEALNITLKPHTEFIKVTMPEIKREAIKVESVAELLDKLRTEEKLL